MTCSEFWWELAFIPSQVWNDPELTQTTVRNLHGNRNNYRSFIGSSSYGNLLNLECSKSHTIIILIDHYVVLAIVDRLIHIAIDEDQHIDDVSIMKFILQGGLGIEVLSLIFCHHWEQTQVVPDFTSGTKIACKIWKGNKFTKKIIWQFLASKLVKCIVSPGTHTLIAPFVFTKFMSQVRPFRATKGGDINRIRENSSNDTPHKFQIYSKKKKLSDAIPKSRKHHSISVYILQDSWKFFSAVNKSTCITFFLDIFVMINWVSIMQKNGRKWVWVASRA